MFDQQVDRSNFDQQEPEYQELLRRVLTIQADCEIGGPHLYVDHILPGAPTTNLQAVVARTAAEEVDHFRKFARLAGDIGTDVSHTLRWSNQQRYVEAFRTAITDWESFAVFGFLIDRVGKYQLEEFVDCSYAPLAETVPTMLHEEQSHINFGTMETAKLVFKGGEQKERVQQALDYWYPKALDMFGSSESKRSERFRYWSLKRRTNAEQRTEYVAEIDPLIVRMGLDIPDPLAGRLYL